MRVSHLTTLTLWMVAILGCRTDVSFLAPPAGTTDAGAADEGANATLPEPVNDMNDCSRFLTRIDGSTICLDDILPALLAIEPLDNDGDGIPNLNDEDIDGDGIPNGYDLDVDGDGQPNSTDDDIDDDGVPNGNDVDIDGDFIRNRWDFDMDGDLLYNPRDPDADADGLQKAELPESECGPVELFNDPEACGAACDGSDGNNRGASNGKEDKCNDKGPKVSIEIVDDGSAYSIEPTADELDRFRQNLDKATDGGPSILDDIRAVDPAATDSENLDVVTRQLEASLAELDAEPYGGLLVPLPDAAEAELDARIESILSLSEISDVSLEDAVDLTERFAAAVRSLNASLSQLVQTTIAIDASFDETEPMLDGENAVRFVAISDAADIPAADVPSAIAPTARTAHTLGNQDAAESVWRIVVDQVEAFENDDGSFAFSLIKVARTVDRVANLIDQPTIDSVSDSIANVLAATATSGLDDPLAVIDKLIALADADPTLELGNGISLGEATDAAVEVAADESSSN